MSKDDAPDFMKGLTTKKSDTVPEVGPFVPDGTPIPAEKAIIQERAKEAGHGSYPGAQPTPEKTPQARTAALNKALDVTEEADKYK